MSFAYRNTSVHLAINVRVDLLEIYRETMRHGSVNERDYYCKFVARVIIRCADENRRREV